VCLIDRGCVDPYDIIPWWSSPFLSSGLVWWWIFRSGLEGLGDKGYWLGLQDALLLAR